MNMNSDNIPHLERTSRSSLSSLPSIPNNQLPIPSDFADYAFSSCRSPIPTDLDNTFELNSTPPSRYISSDNNLSYDTEDLTDDEEIEEYDDDEEDNDEDIPSNKNISSRDLRQQILAAYSFGISVNKKKTTYHSVGL